MRQEWVGKRKAVRQTSMIRAEIRFMDDRPPIDCTIIDISKTGARVDAVGLAELPDSFDLFIPARDELKFARIVRREPTFVCVEFMTSRSEDPKLIGEILSRLTELEQAAPGDLQRQPRPAQDNTAAADNTAALERRIANLEAELAAVRGIAEAAAERPMPVPAPSVLPAPAPDRMPEIQALHASLSSLADRIEQAAAVPPAVSTDRFDALVRDVDVLHRQMMDLCATMAALSRPAEPIETTESADELAADVSDLRKSVQTLILLVSQLVRRTSAAA